MIENRIFHFNFPHVTLKATAHGFASMLQSMIAHHGVQLSVSVSQVGQPDCIGWDVALLVPVPLLSDSTTRSLGFFYLGWLRGAASSGNFSTALFPVLTERDFLAVTEEWADECTESNLLDGLLDLAPAIEEDEKESCYRFWEEQANLDALYRDEEVM